MRVSGRDAVRCLTSGPGFDYVVVGAGTAGCALASALVEGGGGRVLLLEGGTAENGRTDAVPDLRHWGSALVPGTRSGRDATATLSSPGPAAISTGRTSALQFQATFSGLLGRRVAYDSGRGLGGSSLVNAGLCCRPPRADLHAWAQSLGNDPRWAVSHLEACIQHIERAFGPTPGIDEEQGKDIDAFPSRLRSAAASAGFPEPSARSGGWPEAGRFTRPALYCTEAGRRVTAFDALISPLLLESTAQDPDVADLVVASGCSAHRLLSTVKDQRLIATGVGVHCALEREAVEVVEVKARRDVVLCCGAIESPVLLRAAEGERDTPLPLADHACLPFMWLATRRPLGGRDRSSSGAQAWLHLGEDKDRPDTFVVFVDGAMAVPLVPHLVASPLRLRCGPRIPRALAVVLDAALALAHYVVFRLTALAVTLPWAASFIRARAVGALVGAYAPHSRGTLSKLDSTGGPDVDPGLLTDARDEAALRRGLRAARLILHGRELKVHGLVECLWLIPFWLHAALFFASWFHPMATLAMGKARAPPSAEEASEGVPAVDARMRPHGWAAGLRVADASVLPTPVAAPPSLAIAALARRAGLLLASEQAESPRDSRADG